MILLFSAMSVDIQITYEAPPDFNLPSPPYYRPASSVKLSCVVHGASGSVQWSFSSSQTHDSQSDRWQSMLITADDAGVLLVLQLMKKAVQYLQVQK